MGNKSCHRRPDPRDGHDAPIQIALFATAAEVLDLSIQHRNGLFQATEYRPEDGRFSRVGPQRKMERCLVPDQAVTLLQKHMQPFLLRRTGDGLVQIVGLPGDVPCDDLRVAGVSLAPAGHALGIVLDVTRVEQEDSVTSLLRSLNHKLVMAIGRFNADTRLGRHAGQPLGDGRG
jgi:hypothetical protein